jgi:hypothetical protein
MSLDAAPAKRKPPAEEGEAHAAESPPAEDHAPAEPETVEEALTEAPAEDVSRASRNGTRGANRNRRHLGARIKSGRDGRGTVRPWRRLLRTA